MNTGLLIGSAVIAVVVAPLIGGLLKGVDRKLTARMQGRMGPPVMQPFYDLIKLFAKKPMVAGRTQVVFAYAFLGLTVTAVVFFALGQDLLLVLFILFFGSLALPLGALSVKSPYSQFGGHRELLQVLAYEPVLLLAAIPIALKVDGFAVSAVVTHGEPLLPGLLITFFALLIALAMVMRKSPFDISGSEHAHQELVRGVVTEYSGPYLALIELGHWYETVLVLAVVGLFWVGGAVWWLSIVVPVLCWFAVLVLDNISARLTWSWMMRFAWGAGIGLIGLNMLFIHLGWM